MAGIGTFDVGKRTENGAGMDKLFSKRKSRGTAQFSYQSCLVFPTLAEFSGNQNDDGSDATSEGETRQYGTDEERHRYGNLLRQFESQKPTVPYAATAQSAAKVYAAQTEVGSMVAITSWSVTDGGSEEVWHNPRGRGPALENSNGRD